MNKKKIILNIRWKKRRECRFCGEGREAMKRMIQVCETKVKKEERRNVLEERSKWCKMDNSN